MSNHFYPIRRPARGRLYGAKTPPHMFVIDKNGALQYMGAPPSHTQ
jgi:hypothetical protein